MLLDALATAFGLLLLLGGGDVLVRGAASLARRVGVSPLAIGLTVVAFGTSSPEFAVNIAAAWRGNGAMSFGNIIGSNMANIGLIISGCALLRPLEIKNVVTVREVPMMLLATALVTVLGLDPILSGRPGRYDRGDGLALLLLSLVFLYYTVNDVVAQRRRAQGNGEAIHLPAERPIATSVLLIALGLAALVAGAEFTVTGAVGLARAFGVGEEIIGLTVVAVGTSLPELAASGVATLRGETDLAIGNVVGSNIFNVLMILGTTAVIRPVPVPPGGAADLGVLCALSVLVWLASSRIGAGRIVRAEAAALLALYVGYMTLRAFG
jgi:cation:H+ antiporter